MPITVPSTDEIREVVREELAMFFSNFPIQPSIADEDTVGGIDLAVDMTGLAKPTIYGLVSERKIPHSKRGGKLYFSRRELEDWIKSGKRATQDEIAGRIA